jgi:hypothetical protein
MFLIARLQERSTVSDLAAAVAAAALLPWPYNALSLAACILKGLIPDAPAAGAPVEE